MKKKILVVDDDPRISRALANYFGREGYGVRTALDGEEMRRRITEKPPDLVVLDLILPDEDGLTLARELRAHSSVPRDWKLGLTTISPSPLTSESCWLTYIVYFGGRRIENMSVKAAK